MKIIPTGIKFTLVGGCFDLIHVGHLHLLENAASFSDMLVVAVLSDKYIKTYKDRMRPVINQEQRARMVASIRFVDFAYISEVSPSSPETLQLLKPDCVVFEESPETAEKNQRRAENIKRYSPRTHIRLLPRYSEAEISTGKIIRRIRGIVT